MEKVSAKELAELERQSQADLDWSTEIAKLAADSLVRANVVDSAKFQLAVDIIAQDIWIRLGCNDRPVIAS